MAMEHLFQILFSQGMSSCGTALLLLPTKSNLTVGYPNLLLLIMNSFSLPFIIPISVPQGEESHILLVMFPHMLSRRASLQLCSCTLKLLCLPGVLWGSHKCSQKSSSCLQHALKCLHIFQLQSSLRSYTLVMVHTFFTTVRTRQKRGCPRHQYCYNQSQSMRQHQGSNLRPHAHKVNIFITEPLLRPQLQPVLCFLAITFSILLTQKQSGIQTGKWNSSLFQRCFLCVLFFKKNQCKECVQFFKKPQASDLSYF